MGEEGSIGELTAVHCDFFVGAHFGGFRDAMAHPLLLDMAIHTLDAARFMSGKTPLSVYCMETNPRGSWYAQGAAANAIFVFSDEVVFNYRGSWCAEGANTSWESAWRLIGTKGTLLWDGLDSFAANIVTGDDGFFRPLASIEVPPPANEVETHGHASVIENFIAAVKSGDEPETAASDNIKSLAMVFAAIESADKKQPIAITF
jgi:predicted dehydrogenase